MPLTSSELHELVVSSEQFLVPLRMGEGFDRDKFQNLCLALNKCATIWATRDSIPKLAANILVDLYPSIISASYLYSTEGDQIREEAEIIADLVREIVKV